MCQNSRNKIKFNKLKHIEGHKSIITFQHIPNLNTPMNNIFSVPYYLKLHNVEYRYKYIERDTKKKQIAIALRNSK